eukprot:288713_1
MAVSLLVFLAIRCSNGRHNGVAFWDQDLNEFAFNFGDEVHTFEDKWGGNKHWQTIEYFNDNNNNPMVQKCRVGLCLCEVSGTKHYCDKESVYAAHDNEYNVFNFEEAPFDIARNGDFDCPNPIKNWHRANMNAVIATSKHHVISREILKNFWNKVKTDSQMHELGDLFEALKLRVPHCAARLDAMKVAGFWGAVAANVCDNTILKWYLWLPGNLFIGPTQRTDDAGEEFEYVAKKLMNNNDRYTDLERAHHWIKRYMGMDHRSPAAAKANVIQIAADHLTEVAKRANPHEYNPQKWKLVIGYAVE